MSHLKIGLVQMSCGEDLEANFAKALDGIRQAAQGQAQVVCLQELFRSRYFCSEEEVERFDLAEPIPGPSSQRLGEACKEWGIYLVAPVFEKRAPGLYHNSSVLIDPRGRIVGHYRKMHIPDDPGFYEKFYFAPGDLGFSASQTSAGNLGMLICWDQWFPEAARLTALKGAEVLFYPTAIGWAEGEKDEVRTAQHQAWETVQRGHAVANGVFVAAVNRVGREGNLTFWGQSFVCDPFGQVIARASGEEEEVLVVDCDLSRVEEVRRHWPFLRDRRIDAYQGIERRVIDGRVLDE
ncbi:MAG TPA: carbon-nitrogen hydrolase [Acidobacteriota bacterium]|nr:carbon-nitrogen hydrolase [Acidobacteriota bacterium]